MIVTAKSIEVITFPRVEASKEQALEILSAEAKARPDEAAELMSYHDSFSRISTRSLKDYVLQTDREMEAARKRVMATHARAARIGSLAPKALYGGLACAALALGHLEGWAQVAGLGASLVPFAVVFATQQVIESRAQGQWEAVDSARQKLWGLRNAADKVNQLYPDYKIANELKSALKTDGDVGVAFLENEITVGDFSLERHED